VNFLPYYLPGWFAGRMSRRQTDYATTRLLASVVAFPLFWALETLLVGWVAGLRWALPFFLSLPVGGLIAYQYLGGTGRLRHQLRFGALLLTRAQEARRLVAERREIVEELERARRDYLAGREAITSSRSDTSSAGDGSMGDRTVFAIAVCLALLLATFVFGAGGLAHSILP
jgi:glycerol-3-phosphate O-acyltransferase / dihydroxyacetone phosphate acyltransferase